MAMFNCLSNQLNSPKSNKSNICFLTNAVVAVKCLYMEVISGYYNLNISSGPKSGPVGIIGEGRQKKSREEEEVEKKEEDINYAEDFKLTFFNKSNCNSQFVHLGAHRFTKSG